MNRRELLRELSRVQATWVNRNTPGSGDVDVTAEQEQDYLTRISAVIERAREEVRRKRSPILSSDAMAATQVIVALLAGFDKDQARDQKGRWSERDGVSTAERVNGIISRFTPVGITTNSDASDYLATRKPRLTSMQEGAVDRYTGDRFLDLNRELRAGDTSDPDVARLDAAMQPLPDDMVLTRRVDLAAFGVTNGEDLAALRGQPYTDRAYMSTSLGTAPYGGDLGGVTLKIAAPKGTPAVLAAAISRNPTEREVLLGRGLKMVITSVRPNERFGYDVSAVIVPEEGRS